MSLDEQFGANLVRVIKKVKRRSPDGGVKVVKQAFHVRKARPDDEYSSSKGGSKIPPFPKRRPGQPILDPSSSAEADPEQQAVTPEPEPEPVTRMEVRYHDLPWLDKKTKPDEEEQDPVPASLRKRYEKGNRALQTVNPDFNDVDLFSVQPTDRILWGVDEVDLMRDLKSGFVRKMVVVKPKSGMMLARIESPRGGSYSAYLWLEALREPVLKAVWGELVDLENDGALARRASAAYEVAKACGLDDVIPPTVHRYDEQGDLMSVLPGDLIEQQQVLVDWVSRETGDDPEDVRKRLGGHALVQLVRDRLWTVDEEPWFQALFVDDGEEKDALNNPWENLPEDRRVSLLRLAMFDTVVWSLDRSLGDLVFCDNPKHPVVCYGNGLSIPCPKCLGKRFISAGAGPYSALPETPVQAIPLMWNDLLTMLSVRGGDAEFEVCDKIGADIAGRMRGDRPMELARSLLERGLTSLQVAGVLSRVWMLATHAKDIAKDPYFAARFYAGILQGGKDSGDKGIEAFVDRAMSHAVHGEFSFSKEMKAKGDDEDHPG